MRAKNILVCRHKNGKIGPSSICRSLGRVWHPLLKNTFHWGCFTAQRGLQSPGFTRKQLSWCLAGTLFLDRKLQMLGLGTAGWLAQHRAFLRSHLLTAPRAGSLGCAPAVRRNLGAPAGLFPSGICTGNVFLKSLLPARLAQDGGWEPAVAPGAVQQLGNGDGWRGPSPTGDHGGDRDLHGTIPSQTCSWMLQEYPRVPKPGSFCPLCHCCGTVP